MAVDANNVRGQGFGAHLRRLRQDARLTQAELAERAGISERTVSDLERGFYKTPRGDTAFLLAAALGLDDAERDAFFLAAREARPVPAAPDPGAAFAPPPAPAAPLLGRDDALAALLERIAAPGIVTLLGPGGVGKTRLALEVAHRAAEAGRPVAWAPLEALGSAEEVLPAVARAVGAGGMAGGDLLANVVEAAGDRPLLLVVDNAEHVVDAAGDLAAVAAALPRATLLVTSREALRITSEAVLPVAPLAVPDASDRDGPAAASPAVRLFADRTAGLGAEADDLGSVRRVVTLLDGLPLAIELAAAQRHMFSAETIAGLLERAGLAVLEGGRRDAHARLRSMDAAIRWSADLLDGRARRLLRLLAVFRGGVDPPTLLAACDALGDPALAGGLVALSRSSLVSERTQEDGARRISMLSPIRMFAAAELDAAGERPAAEAAHRAVMLDHARRARDLVAGPDALAGLAAFDRERDNLVAALERAIRASDGSDAIELASAMAWWWENRSEAVEGLRWLELALATPGADARPDDAMWALAVAFVFSYFLGRHDRAAGHAAEMERIARQAGRDDLLGAARVFAGDLAWGVDGDLDTAAARYDEGLALLEPFGPTLWLGQAHARAADAATERGDPAAALLHIDGALAIRDALGQVVFRSSARLFRGAALEALGRRDDARAAFGGALDDAMALGQPLFAAHALIRLACLDATGDNPARRRRAPMLLGSALGTMAARRIALDPTLEPFVAEARAALAAAFGEDTAERLLDEGRDLPLAEAAALAGA